MKLSAMLDYHFKKSKNVNLSQILINGNDRFGFHPMELQIGLLKERGENFVKRISYFSSKLKKQRTENFFQFSKYRKKKLCLYDLVRLWNLNKIKINSDEYIKAKYEFRNLTREEFLAVHFNQVLRGELPKRDLRLHFHNIEIPVVFSVNHHFEKIDLRLNSISKTGLLLEVDRVIEEVLKKSSLVDISLALNSLLDEDNTHYKASAKTRSYNVDMSKVVFNQSSIEKALPLRNYERLFMWVPFDALTDSIFQNKVNCGEEMEDLIKVYRNALAAA